MWTIPKQSKRGTARDATTSGREFHWLSFVFPNNKTPLVRTRRARARACNTLCRTYWQTAEPLRATDPQRSINDRGLLESLDQSSRKRWGEWKDICCPLSSNRGLRYFINSVLSKYNLGILRNRIFARVARMWAISVLRKMGTFLVKIEILDFTLFLSHSLSYSFWSSPSRLRVYFIVYSFTSTGTVERQETCACASREQT